VENLKISTGYALTLLGHALFLIFLVSISIFLTPEEYSYYRYWFNAAALVSQLLIFGLDVSVIKGASTKLHGRTFDLDSLKIMGGIATAAFIICIPLSYLYGSYLTTIVFFGIIWSLSNFLLAYLRVLFPARVAFFHTAILLRFYRLILVIPIILFGGTLAAIIILTVCSQISFTLGIIIKLRQKFKDSKIEFIHLSRNVNYFILNYGTVLFPILLLKSDVIFTFLTGKYDQYQAVDYAMIFIAFCHVTHQVKLRNQEYLHSNSYHEKVSGIDHKMICASGVVFVVILAILALKLFTPHYDKEIYIFTIIVSGYQFYFGFGPIVEISNLNNTRLKPLIIVAISALASYFSMAVFWETEFSLPLTIATFFALARIGHVISEPELYPREVFLPGLTSAIFAVVGLSIATLFHFSFW